MRKGLLIGDSGDLLIINGGLVIDNSDDQNVEFILSAVKGEFKENPLLGVGLINYINKQNNRLEHLKRAISINLQTEGYSIESFSFDNSEGLKIDYKLK